jgi:hypothetical protein
MSTSESSVSLLRAAAAEPFALLTEQNAEGFAQYQNLSNWARHLRASYPLWSLQPRAYAALRSTDLPTTYPLRKIAQSIAVDEGLLGNPMRGMLTDKHCWLPMVLDSRRCGLSRDDVGSWISDSVDEVDGELRLIGSFGSLFPRNLEGAVLASYEENTEYSDGGYISPYEEIGVELVRLIEERDAVAGTNERALAQKRLDEFVKSLSVKVPGSPTILRDEPAKKIFDEGCRLIALCAEAFEQDIVLGNTAERVFDAYMIPRCEMLEWATRLVLPNLSQLELRALLRRVRASNHVTQGREIFAREFTLQLMAHRLRTVPDAVARKVMGGWDAATYETYDQQCAICEAVHERTATTSA